MPSHTLYSPPLRCEQEMPSLHLSPTLSRAVGRVIQLYTTVPTLLSPSTNPLTQSLDHLFLSTITEALVLQVCFDKVQNFTTDFRFP